MKLSIDRLQVLSYNTTLGHTQEQLRNVDWVRRMIMFISHFFGMDASTASATNYLKKFTKHGGLVEGSGFEKDYWEFLLIVHFIKVLVTGQMTFGWLTDVRGIEVGVMTIFFKWPIIKMVITNFIGVIHTQGKIQSPFTESVKTLHLVSTEHCTAKQLHVIGSEPTLFT